MMLLYCCQAVQDKSMIFQHLSLHMSLAHRLLLYWIYYSGTALRFCLTSLNWFQHKEQG